MAKNSDSPKKSAKAPKSKAHRADVKPIGPALAELLNPAINRGESGLGSGTGLQPPPDNSWDRRNGGEAAAHRARKSTPKGFREGEPHPTPLHPYPQPQGTQKNLAQGGMGEKPQANYGTSAPIPTLDPDLAKQLGYDVEDDDSFRPARNKMESLGVKATAAALE